MIPLTQKLCETLDLVYWKLKDNDSVQETNSLSIYHLPEDQKELLKKILLAIQIQLDNSMIQSIEDNKVIIQVKNKTLIFEDVSINDTSDTVYLSGLAQMQQDPAFKKQTWLKLKAAFL